MKKIVWFLLVAFLSFTVLAGCSGSPTDAKLGEQTESPKLVEKERDEPVKSETEREIRIDQIRSSLVERGLIGENDKTYGLGEEIDLSGRTYITPFGETTIEGLKYYVVLPRIRYEKERKIFHLGVNLFGERTTRGRGNRFPLDINFGMLVNDEVVLLRSDGMVNTTIRHNDGKTNVRYNFQGRDRRIIEEKLKKPTDVVLFFEIARRTDTIILLEKDIDWDAW